VTFVTGAVAFALALSLADASVLTDPAVYVLGGLVVLGDLLPVTVRRRGTVERFMASATFSVALLLYAGPAPAIAAFVLASLISDVRARCSWERVVFNVGQYAFALVVASVVLTALGHPAGALRGVELTGAILWPLLPAGLAFFLTNHLVVGAIIALDLRSSLLPILREDLLFQITTSGVLVAMAPVVVVVTDRSLWLLPALLVPVLALHLSSKQSVADAERANVDRLTGLPNRGRFQQILRWELDDARSVNPGALLLIDLGRFGEVNETLGHRAGDELLKLVGERLRGAAGEDAKVARVGGDEFGVLATGVAAEDAALALAERVRHALARPFEIETFSFHLRPRIGLALYPRDAEDGETLLRHGDVAMHLAKQGSSEVEVYSGDHDRAGRRRLAVVSELRTAIATGELRVHLQPKADLQANRIVGVEALARWDSPRLGRVGPDEFIPLAERAGLIDALTDLVLDRALAGITALRRAGFPLHVAVNVSMQSLQDPNLPGRIAEHLARWDVDPADLHLEMTESAILEGDAESGGEGQTGRAVLDELRRLGVRVAVDDFGTGYSSLARLKHLPVDQLKIDRSFVQDMEHDVTDAAIIRASLELARTLGLVVVAEGVETLAAWNALRDLGCDQVQGFFISRPLSAEDLLAWLRTRVGRQDGSGRVPALLEEVAGLDAAAAIEDPEVTPLFQRRG
jgi:diguanylate cyclase (GGDEF)-like protein